MFSTIQTILYSKFVYCLYIVLYVLFLKHILQSTLHSETKVQNKFGQMKTYLVYITVYAIVIMLKSASIYFQCYKLKKKQLILYLKNENVKKNIISI